MLAFLALKERAMSLTRDLNAISISLVSSLIEPDSLSGGMAVETTEFQCI